MTHEPTAEDEKILTLARGAQARVGAGGAACVRDTEGRTYAAVPVDLASLSLSAVQLAVAVAAGSGATGLEAVAVVGTAADLAAVQADLPVVRDLGGGDVPVWTRGAEGSPVLVAVS